MTDATDAQDSPAATAPQVSGTDPGPGEGAAHPAPVPLLEPREGIPPVIADPESLADAVAAFAGGSGPVAVDAERASGYRYGQRAYLVQLRRAGAGTALIDPVACPDLSGLGAALASAEWDLHAATQDLPCLREIGMVPHTLFDTELAGRLAGFPRVGLGAMVENVLGYTLEKGHSAVDWSTRPLPEPWLRYAALDVELLVDLRDALEKELDRQGKLEWALEEFDAIATAPPPAPRKDPWRRTSGMHRVRRRRQLAVVRELWTLRDRIARRRDVSPGKVLPDAAIVEAALAVPVNAQARRRAPRLRAAGAEAAARPVAGRHRPRQGTARRRAPAAGRLGRRAPAAARLGGPRPGGGGPPLGRARGRQRARREAAPAPGEPDHPRHGPPRLLGAPGLPRPGRGRGGTARARGEALADRARDPRTDPSPPGPR
ncbi:ribonuclease D [Streptomyces sp. SPB074]|nr:ribonuclease D [Streptomyces sp. SPB074]